MTRDPSKGPENMVQDDSQPSDQDANSVNRSATARGAEWASKIMTISLEMVLPGLAGYWLDKKLGLNGLFMILGFAVGSLIAFKQLMAIAKKGQSIKGLPNKGLAKKRTGRKELSDDPTVVIAEITEKDKS